jgi:autotransporter-associated beta strand protein
MGTAQNRRVTENELRATTTSVQRKRRLISGSTAVAAAAAAAAVAVIQTAPADAGTYGWARGVANTYSWNNTTTFGDATNGNNWNSALVPNFPSAAGDIANLTPGAGAGTETIDLDQAITIGALTVGSGNSSTGIVNLNSSGPTNPQTFTLTFNNSAADATLTHNTTNAPATINAPLAIGGDGNLTITNSNTSTTTTFLTIPGGITSALSSGTQTLKTTAGLVNISGILGNGGAGGTLALSTTGGALTLGGVNTYSGGTTIGGGSVLASNNLSLGSGAVSVSAVTGAQLQLASGVNISNSLTINGGGATGQGVVWVPTSNANATYSGNVAVNGAANSGGDFATNGGTLTVSGVITSSGPAVSVRTGTVLFTNTGSSYTSMTVNAGTVKVGAINALATGANVDLGASGAATLDLNGFNQQLAGVSKNANGATVTNSGAADAVLTLTGTQSFSGVIQNGATNKTGLTINGGAFTLNGANTYTGNTNVTNNGSLSFATAASSIGTVTLADNTSLGVKTAAAGTTPLTTTALTLGSSGTSTLNFDFNNLNPTVTQISTGALTANGTIAVNFANPNTLASGTYPLISYTSMSGGGTFPGSTYVLTPRTTGTISNSGTAISLVVSSDSPLWTGADSGSWVAGSTGSNHNWKLLGAGTGTDYIQGDVVLFNDSATGTTTIDISAANVNPTSTTFNNSTAPYTVNSSGGFGIASGSLTKSGSASLTINTANTYTGGTTVNLGTVNIGNATALGTGNITINGGTIDNSTGGPLIMTANNTQNWNGDFTFTGTNALDMGTGNVTLGGAGDRTLTLAANTLTVGKILDSGTHGLNLQGAGTLIVTSVGAANTSSVINGTLTVGAGTTLQINRTGAVAASSGDFTAGGLSGTGTITNGAAVERWLFVNNASGNMFSGTLTNGTGSALGLNKGGAGTLTLNGTLNYTGTTTVNAGTLSLPVANASAGTPVTMNGGTLVLGNASALGTASNIQFPANSTGALDIALPSGSDIPYTIGTNTTSNITILSDVATPGPGVTHSVGAVTVGGGSIAVQAGPNVSGGAAALSIPSINMTAGSTQTTTINPISATVTIGSVSNGAAQTHTLALDGTSTGNAVTGVISNAQGTLGVAKSNTSTWTLSGANTYSGGTTITGTGTLVMANPSALGAATGAVNISGGATLDIQTNGGDSTYNLNEGSNSTGFTLVSDLPGTGAGINHTLGTLSVGINDTVNATAGANVNNSGTASISLGAVAFSSGVGAGPSTFNPTTANLILASASSTTASAKTMVLDGTSSGNQVTGVIADGTNTGSSVALTKSNTSTWTLLGTNTYTGATTISGGTLQLGDGTTDGTIAGTSGVTDNGTLIYNWAGGHTVPYVIGGSGAVTKNGAGTVTFAAAHTYAGNTTVNAGAMVVGAGGMLPSGTNLTSNGTTQFSNAAAQSIGTLNGSASGVVTVDSGASLTIGAIGAYAGAINAGGTVNFPGNNSTTPATQTIGSLNVPAGGKVTIASSPDAFVPMTLQTAAITPVGGTIDITDNAFIAPGSAGDAKTLIVNGNVVTTNNSSLVLGYRDVAGGNFEIRATLLGDSDLDGQVNVADLANLAGNFGVTTGMLWINGDFDNNGNVNVADLADLAGNFGKSSAGLNASDSSAAAAPAAIAAGAAAVPEPTAIGLLGIGAFGLVGRRRHRSRNRQK